MSYRDDLEALTQRCAALERDMASSAQDLAEARRLLAAARERHRLPVLDNLSIAAPCSADWNDMKGDARARFCGQCEKNVYDLSSMTRPEAEALLIEKEGKLCARYYQRADGTILTADCPDGVVRRRRKKRLVALTFGAMSVAAAATSVIHGRTRVMMGAPPPSHVTMGKIALAVPVGPVEPPVMVMGEPGPMPRMGAVAISPPHPKMGKLKTVK